MTKSFQLSRQKTVKILRFFDQKAKENTRKSVSFFAEIEKDHALINCNRLAKLCDNHTSKLLKDYLKSLQSKDEVTSPQEVEVEEELEEDIKTLIGGYTPPTPDEIENASKTKLQKDLTAICKVLYYTKIFADAPKFINTMKKRTKNQRTILHTMVACYRKKTFDDENGAWAYCMQIIKIEDGNFNERDNTKTS